MYTFVSYKSHSTVSTDIKPCPFSAQMLAESATLQQPRQIKSFLGCIHWDIAGDRYRIIPLFPVLVRLHLFCYLQFWAPEIKEDAEGLERVKECCEGDQRAEEPSLRKSWRSFVSSSWRKDCSWRPNHNVPILKGQTQREWKQAQGEGMRQWHLYWERFHIDIRNCSQ